jgi:opacity protein-like surface antigen
MKKSILMSVVVLLMAMPSAQAAVTLSSVSGSWSGVVQDAGGNTIYDTVYNV